MSTEIRTRSFARIVPLPAATGRPGRSLTLKAQPVKVRHYLVNEGGGTYAGGSSGGARRRGSGAAGRGRSGAVQNGVLQDTAPTSSASGPQNSWINSGTRSMSSGGQL
jgi:hypothetical protein